MFPIYTCVVIGSWPLHQVSEGPSSRCQALEAGQAVVYTLHWVARLRGKSGKFFPPCAALQARQHPECCSLLPYAFCNTPVGRFKLRDAATQLTEPTHRSPKNIRNHVNFSCDMTIGSLAGDHDGMAHCHRVSFESLVTRSGSRLLLKRLQ